MPADLSAAVDYECIDLCDAGAVSAYIARIRPAAIYHLAGQAAVHASWGDPWAWFQGNVQSQVNVLEAARRLQPHPRIVVVTSGQVYGSVASGKPLTDEDRELRPDTPYGTSKAAQDWLARQAFVHYGLPIIRLRPFNHIGPRQSSDFVATSFARQLVRIAAGQQPPRLLVGNLPSLIAEKLPCLEVKRKLQKRSFDVVVDVHGRTPASDAHRDVFGGPYPRVGLQGLLGIGEFEAVE